MQNSAQEHGGDPLLSWPNDKKRQRDQDYEDQNQLNQSRRKHIADSADCKFRQKSARHVKFAQQIEQQPVLLAYQCLDVLVEWLCEKAAEKRLLKKPSRQTAPLNSSRRPVHTSIQLFWNQRLTIMAFLLDSTRQ